MPKKIRYSIRAGLEQEALYDYLFEKFGEATVIKIDSIIEKVKWQIALMPFLGKVANKNNVKLRYVVVKKKLKIYYRVSKEYIEIASFRDVRMNPKTINLK